MSRITIVLCLCLCALCSCRKNNNGGSFTYKGRWLEDCGGAPVVNKSVGVVMYVHGFDKKDSYSASSVTDANGNFSLTLPNNGAINIFTFYGGPYIPITSTDAGNGIVYDLGTVYSRCSTEAVIRVRFNTSHADTFYIGNSALSPLDSIYPATGTAYIHLSMINRTWMDYDEGTHSYNYSTKLGYRYGFGRQHYYDTLNTNGGPKLVYINNAFAICNPPDTVDLYIP